MKITYATSKVEKYFADYSKLQRKIDPAWVKTIIKQMNALKAADRFADFLALGLWHPEQLSGNDSDCWSLRISGNVRLIIKPSADGKSVMICTEVEVEGVCDYHGDKNNWYIP